MSPWHCARKYRGWVTYCGIDLTRRVSPSRRREFRHHAHRDTFLEETDRKCATCATAARAEEYREQQAAGVDWKDPEAVAQMKLPRQVLEALAGLRTFRRAAKKAGLTA